MNSKKNKRESLPFTQNGYTRQFKSGPFRDGGAFKQVEKVRVIGRGTMGAKLEDIHIIYSCDIDKGGNKTINKRKGQHFLSLSKGGLELAFAIDGNSGWLIIPYDCSYFESVNTQHEAEEILKATNWRKWANSGRKKGEE
jgi:hypothetical protein